MVQHQLEFALQINNFEKVNVRCILFQRSSSNLAEIPPPGWEKRFYSALVPDQAEALFMAPRHKLTADDVADLHDGKLILEKYAQWKSDRDKKLFSQ